MKKRIFAICCIVVILVTFTISSFATGSYDMDMDTPVTMIPYKDIYIKNNNLTGDDVDNDNRYRYDMISYQSSELPLGDSTYQTVNGTAINTITNHLTTSDEGFRSLIGLQYTKIYVNSPEWYSSNLNLYNPTTIGWTDIILYDLPEMYYIPTIGSTPERITELRFRVSEIKSGDNSDYVDFRLGFQTENRAYGTMVNTETGYLRHPESNILIKYTQTNYDNFLKTYFPIPEQAYNPNTDWNDAIANVYKNRITFGIIGFTTPNYTNSYTYNTSSRDNVQYKWTRENPTGHVILTSNFPTRQTGVYTITAEPFVITTKEAFQELINTAPKLSAHLSAARIYITYQWTLLTSLEHLTNTENDEGSIVTEITEKGLYSISGRNSEYPTNGSLFLTTIPNIEYTFQWNFDENDTKTYRYENNPQPILISDLEIEIEIDWSQVSDESDYKYMLRINQSYFDSNTPTRSIIRNVSNYFYKNTNVGEYAPVNALGFTVFRNELNPPEPEPWDLFDFFSGTLSVFSIPIFGVFSLSTILLTVIAIGVIFAVLKYFAGG